MLEILSLGFLLGMRHALESDHVAAVASLVTRSSSLHESIRLGSAWGVGHTLTLLLFGSMVMLLDQLIPERLALMLEFAVGIMLVGLGIDVIRRLRKERIHLHPHQHLDGTVHMHAHSHMNSPDSEHPHHEHDHRGSFPLRAMFVGIMHGMAGTAALIVLTLQTVQSFAQGLIYIALFGVGSIIGMAVLSAIIMIPLTQSARRFSSLHHYLQAGIGSLTIVLGISMMIELGSQVVR